MTIYHLLAYPRSGSTLARLLIGKYMGVYPEHSDPTRAAHFRSTGRWEPLSDTQDLGDFFTSELENPSDALRLDRFQLSPPGPPPHRNSLEPKLIKYHYSRELPSPDPSDVLLLQLRNPLENVISWWVARCHNLFGHSMVPDPAKINSFVGRRGFLSYLDDYGKNLEAYKTWPGRKVILGYEDLMLRPKKYFTDLSIVLLKQLDESFLENIPVLKSRLLGRDDKNPTLAYRPITRGEDVEFFRNMLTVANRERVDVLLPSIAGHQRILLPQGGDSQTRKYLGLRGDDAADFYDVDKE